MGRELYTLEPHVTMTGPLRRRIIVSYVLDYVIMM